jgi:hypothetical protein
MKKIYLFIISFIVLIIIFLGIVFIYNEVNHDKSSSDNPSEKTTDLDNEIPNDYVAVFHGGSGEVTYETYIYKIDNGHDNYGFQYINVVSHNQSYGSSKWNHKVTGKGVFDWTDGAFTVAKKNNAYSYVTEPNNDNIYTIEEFQSRFIMN